jgi:hypothetical protein
MAYGTMSDRTGRSEARRGVKEGGAMASTALRLAPRKLAVAVASLAILAPPHAHADDDPRAAIAKLESDAGHQAIVADALVRAREALERATRLHALHDEEHAAEADGLALEWASVGRDLVRAVDAETKAAQARRKAAEAQAQLDRSRALVEEAIARVGRLETEIAQAQRSNRTTHTAVESHASPPPSATDRPSVSPPKSSTPKGSAPKISAPRGSDPAP